MYTLLSFYSISLSIANNSGPSTAASAPAFFISFFLAAFHCESEVLKRVELIFGASFCKQWEVWWLVTFQFDLLCDKLLKNTKYKKSQHKVQGVLEHGLYRTSRLCDPICMWLGRRYYLISNNKNNNPLEFTKDMGYIQSNICKFIAYVLHTLCSFLTIFVNVYLLPPIPNTLNTLDVLPKPKCWGSRTPFACPNKITGSYLGS